MCGLIWGIFRSVVERQKRELKEIGYLLRDDGWKRGLKRWGFSAWVNLGFWGLVGAVYVAVTGLRIVVVQVGVTMMTLGAGISGGEKTKEEVANRLKELVRRRNEVYWDAGVLTIVADALVVAGVVAYGLWGMWLRKDIGRGGSASVSSSFR